MSRRGVKCRLVLHAVSVHKSTSHFDAIFSFDNTCAIACERFSTCDCDSENMLLNVGPQSTEVAEQ